MPASVVVSYKERRAPTILETLSRQPIIDERAVLDRARSRAECSPPRCAGSSRPPRDVADLTAKIRVVYRPDTATGVWVPAEMTEAYETAQELIDCHAVYTGMRRFTVKVDDSVTLPQ